ncbi:MAG: hypothetical protein ACE5KV_05335 [Thermoplasmata archaeon]
MGIVWEYLTGFLRKDLEGKHVKARRKRFGEKEEDMNVGHSR